MDCRDIQKMIPIYLDQELSREEFLPLEEHLKGCVICQKEFKAYQKFWDILKDWKDLEPDPAYMSRFWARLGQKTPGYKKVIRDLKLVFLRLQVNPALVVVCMCLFLTFFLGKHYSQGQVENTVARLSSEEIELLEHMELAQHFDVIENIELLEDMDIWEKLDSLKPKNFS